MDAHELEDRIAEFPAWHYSFEFEGGVRTPAASAGAANRHEQRRRYFFQSLLELTGGTLKGRRVLDLGCNAGFWSLASLQAGADFVLGIDAQQMYIDQAELVFTAKEIDRTATASSARTSSSTSSTNRSMSCSASGCWITSQSPSSCSS